MARKKRKPKELYWIADVDKNDVRCLIELSLVAKRIPSKNIQLDTIEGNKGFRYGY